MNNNLNLLQGLINGEGAEFKDIPVNAIKPSPLNTYDVEEGGGYDLRESVRSVGGILSPIAVLEDTDGTYVILSGERRYTALKSLIASGDIKKDTIPCYIIGDVSMPELSQKYIIETANLESRDPKTYNAAAHQLEFIKIVHQMLVEQNEGNDEQISIQLAAKIEEKFKVSPRYAGDYRRVFQHGSDRLKNMFSEGQVTARPAARITGFEPEDQEDILDNIEEGQKPDDAIKKKRLEVNERNRVETTIEELDNMDDDFDVDLGSDIDLGLDSAGLLGTMKNAPSTNLDDDKKYDSKLNSMISWAEKILKKQKLTEKETEVLSVMSEAIEKFL